MLKKIVSVLQVSAFVVAMLVTLLYEGRVSLSVGEFSFDFHMLMIVIVLGLFCLAISLMKSAFQWIVSIFSGKSKHEKGLDNLQMAISGLLLEDSSSSVIRCIQKSKKYLGDLPIISWLEGQQHLMNNDNSRAKAIFYGLCEREKNTALGAFSLYKMAMKEKSDVDALGAISNIMKISPNSSELSFSAVAVSLKNKNFLEAKKYSALIKNPKKRDLIKAIIFSEEGFFSGDGHLLEKAFKLAPGFTENAVRYTDFLVKNGELRCARRVLMRSFEASPNMRIFKMYVSCLESTSALEKLKYAGKLSKAAAFSWVGYFGLGKLAMPEKLYQIAFQNFLAAYRLEQYDFIADALTESTKLLKDPKPQEAIEILSNPLISKRSNFAWRCEHCGQIENEWIPVCEQCNHVGRYIYANLITEEDASILTTTIPFR